MYHCQLTLSTCDYSFSDSEKFTFMLPKELSENFVAEYNKHIRSPNSLVDDVLKMSGAQSLTEDYGLIRLYANEYNTITIEEVRVSKKDLYLIALDFSSFNDSYQIQILTKIKEVSKEKLEELHALYTSELERLTAEAKIASDNWFNAVKSNDIEKKVAKAKRSLKGKDKKSEEKINKITEKIKQERTEKINVLRDISAEKILVKNKLIEDSFHSYFLKELGGEIIPFDFEFESSDESKII